VKKTDWKNRERIILAANYHKESFSHFVTWRERNDLLRKFFNLILISVMALETWLNLSFVEKILRKSEGDDSIQVIDMSTKPATKKGDNYLSDMFRIMIKFSRNQGGNEIKEKKSIIVKLSPIIESIRQKFVS